MFRIALAGMCFLVALLAHGEPWHTFHGDFGLTGYTPSEFKAKPRQVWKTRIGDGLCSAVVGGDGRLFCIADGARLVALDMKGAELWEAEWSTVTEKGEKPVTFEAPPLWVSRTLLVLVSEDGTVYGVDPDKGDDLWSTVTGEEAHGSPNLAMGSGDQPDRVIIMARTDGVLRGLDARLGTLLWTSEEMKRTDGHVAVMGQRAAFGNCDSAIFGVDLGDGEIAWRASLGKECEVAAGAAIADGRVYTGNRHGAVVAADMTSGGIIWTNSMSEAALFSTPAVHGGRVVVCDEDGMVRALSAFDGAELWRYETDGRDVQSPVIAGDTVIAGADGALHAIDLSNGTARWKLDVGDEVSQPTIIDGVLVVGSDDGFVMGYRSGE